MERVCGIRLESARRVDAGVVVIRRLAILVHGRARRAHLRQAVRRRRSQHKAVVLVVHRVRYVQSIHGIRSDGAPGVPVHSDVFFFPFDPQLRGDFARFEPRHLPVRPLLHVPEPCFRIDLRRQRIGRQGKNVALMRHDFDARCQLVRQFHVHKFVRRQVRDRELDVALRRRAHLARVRENVIVPHLHPVELRTRRRILRVRDRQLAVSLSVSLMEDLPRDRDRQIARLVIVLARKRVRDLELHGEIVVAGWLQIQQGCVVVVDRVRRDPAGLDGFDRRSVDRDRTAAAQRRRREEHGNALRFFLEQVFRDLFDLLVRQILFRKDFFGGIAVLRRASLQQQGRKPSALDEARRWFRLPGWLFRRLLLRSFFLRRFGRFHGRFRRFF